MAGGQRRGDTPKVESMRDDDEDVPNRDFAEQVRKGLNVGTNKAALEQLAPYFAGLAKPGE